MARGAWACSVGSAALLLAAVGWFAATQAGFPWPRQAAALSLRGAPAGNGVASAVGLPQDTAAGGAVGACTAEDLKVIEAAGGGHDAGSWTKFNADCGMVSWNLITGMDAWKYSSCLMEKRPVSGQCAQCFAQSGVWAFSECKFKCVLSWCSKSCLECTHANLKVVDACAGAPVPRATACIDA
eukprot:CAMPEP_0170233896 /NCGR_PEP_ID=MMETSP0116_2-20130129/16694_1 /TAXON_ID=400756 /ORGANISM="Durinskia baltica, Strain CSIRO CS-38" /LENGTH=182 /DNA_ID=CAMNT_0010484691 /DNA_START=64 /DNA_END=612 /DNA_ORIENTATION=+